MFLGLTIETSDFFQVPSPSMVVVALEKTYTYYCGHSQTNRIFWQLNGTLFNFVDLPPCIDSSSDSMPGGRRVYSLTIRGVPEYNGTIVQCVAKLNRATIEAINATFLIQGQFINHVVACSPYLFSIHSTGPLQGATNLIRNDSTLSWDAPFSLNLTAVDPDIAYCVEVYNITCGRSLLISECDVMETSYTNDALQPGYIYEYTVTPRSNVEGASNGTSRNASGK